MHSCVTCGVEADCSLTEQWVDCSHRFGWQCLGCALDAKADKAEGAKAEYTPKSVAKGSLYLWAMAVVSVLGSLIVIGGITGYVKIAYLLIRFIWTGGK